MAVVSRLGSAVVTTHLSDTARQTYGNSLPRANVADAGPIQQGVHVPALVDSHIPDRGAMSPCASEPLDSRVVVPSLPRATPLTGPQALP